MNFDARIVRSVNDVRHGFGMIALTDDGPRAADFVPKGDCLLYDHPLAQSKAKKESLRLVCIKQRKMFELLTLGDKEALDLLTYDTNFKVTKAER